jgi:hypothetical protein
MADGDGPAQVFKEVKISFDDFAQSFNAYADRLKETEQIWKNKENIWKSMSSDPTKGIRGMERSMSNLQKSTKDWASGLEKHVGNLFSGQGLWNIARSGLDAFSRNLIRQGRAWQASATAQAIRGTAGATRAIGSAEAAGGSGVGSVEVSLLAGLLGTTGVRLLGLFTKSLGIAGLATTAFGAAATFATIKLAEAGFARGRRAYGLGASIGGMTADEIYMSPFVNADNAMANAAQGRYDITSPQYVAMRAGLGMKGSFAGRDTSVLSEEMIRRTAAVMKQGPEQTALSIAHAKGLGNLFSDEELIRLRETDEKTLAAYIQEARERKSSYELTKDQIDAERKLVVEIQNLEKTFETQLAKWTVDNAKNIADFAKALADDIGNLGKIFGEVSDVIGKIETVLNATNEAVTILGKLIREKLLGLFGLGGTDPTDDSTNYPGRVGRSSVGRVSGAGGGSAAIGNLGVKGFWTPENEKKAYDKLVAGGFTPDAAMGYISRWRYVESSGGPTSVNASSGAYGIAQALGSRKAGYLASGGDFDKQLDQVIRESKGYGGEKSGYLARSAIGDIEGGKAATAFERAEGYSPGSHTDYYTARTIAGIAKIREDLRRLGVKGDHEPPVTDKMTAKPPGPTSMNDLNNYQGAFVKQHVALHVTTPAGANFQVSGGLLGSGSGGYQPA